MSFPRCVSNNTLSSRLSVSLPQVVTVIFEMFKLVPRMKGVFSVVFDPAADVKRSCISAAVVAAACRGVATATSVDRHRGSHDVEVDMDSSSSEVSEINTTRLQTP